MAIAELGTNSGRLPTEELRRCLEVAALLLPVARLSRLVCLEIGLPLLRALLYSRGRSTSTRRSCE